MTTHTSILAQLVLNIVNTSKLKSFHGQRSLVGYSPWGCKELDMAKHTRTHTLMNREFSCMDYQFLKIILAVLGLCCCMDFSVFAANGGCSVVLTHRFLIAVACLVGAPRKQAQ